MRCILLFIIFFILIGVLLLVLQDYGVSFYLGVVLFGVFVLLSLESDFLFIDFLYEGNYYIIVQFDEILDDNVFQVLEQDGVEFFVYIFNYVYLFKVLEFMNFSEFQVCVFVFYDGSFKLFILLAINNFLAYVYNNGLLDIVVSFWLSVIQFLLKVVFEGFGYIFVDILFVELLFIILEDSFLSIVWYFVVQYINFFEVLFVYEGFVGWMLNWLNLFSLGLGL